MKVIVGLGNPGLEYKATKHNIGFEVIKAIAKEYNIKLKERLHFSVLGRGKISGEGVVLVMPETYMNLSGKAVGEIFHREVKDLGDMIIICDDINLELGRVRLRKQGSSGGHKGLDSIIRMLGRDDFARLRIGIAIEVHKGDITKYVLSPFKRKDRRNVAHVIELAKDAATAIVKDGVDAAMNKFNKKKVGTS